MVAGERGVRTPRSPRNRGELSFQIKGYVSPRAKVVNTNQKVPLLILIEQYRKTFDTLSFIFVSFLDYESKDSTTEPYSPGS